MTGLALPTGTVTFLFTDIEGSTRLIEELGEEGYVEALAEHRRLLRGAFAAHGGVEVDTQGDAFLYAFADPAEALAAAAEGQQALALRAGQGADGAAHGRAASDRRGLRRPRAAPGRADRRLRARRPGRRLGGDAGARRRRARRELGEHRLKDFAEPVALFQLGQERFPPLKTISNTNLPRPASSFVGRRAGADELVDLLGNGTRLVTLSGPGGSGKTRLAVEAAPSSCRPSRPASSGSGWRALRDPALVTETIAQTLGAKDGLAEHIGERELLLLLDNFEQVVEAAPELGGCSSAART